MNEYNISDYGIFTNAIGTAQTLNQKIGLGKDAIASCKTVLSNEAVFMGPAASACLEVITSADNKLTDCSTNFGTIATFLQQASESYQKGDQAASSSILNLGGLSGTGTLTLTGDNNQDKIYNYLTSQGLNQAAACGILANIKQESNFKTEDWGDYGTSYGICQWHASRLTELQNYCSSNNLDYNSLEGQLSFLTYELQTKYPDLYSTLQNVPNDADGAYQAAYAFTTKFERPADMEWRGEQRGYSAQEMLTAYNSQGATQV